MILGGPTLSPGHHIATEPAQLESMVRELSEAPEAQATIGLDFETSGLRYANGAKPIGYTLGYLQDGRQPRVWYVPVAHQTAEPQAAVGPAKEAFSAALAGTRRIAGQNLKFDLNMGRAHGFDIPEDPEIADTFIQAGLIYDRRSLKLEKLAEQVVQWCEWDDPWELAEVVTDYCRRRAKDRRMRFKKDDKEAGEPAYMTQYGHAEVPVSIEAEYSCRDVVHALFLDAYQYDEANGVGESWEARRRHLYANEMLLVRALADMEYTGQPVDAQYFHWLATHCDEKLDRMQRELSQAFGAVVRWDNDNEVRDFLYRHLQLPVVKKTDGGKFRDESKMQPAVDRAALLMLREYHPAIELLAEHNAWLKCRQTYTKSIAWYVDADGRIHPSFNQLGTRSGRLSGEKPNFQNVPTRHKAIAALIRAGFLVPPGMVRLYLDYSQIELRFLAWITGSANLTGAYLSAAYDRMLAGVTDYSRYLIERAGEESTDVHGLQAKTVFGARPTDSDWKLKRRAAKIINFGVPYGMGAPGLTGNPELMLDPQTAEDYFSRYHRANPEINSTKEALFHAMTSKDGVPHFINWAGRKVVMPELRSPVQDVRADGERSAFACLVQGSAGELTRFSLTAAYEDRKAGHLPARATSTVHDEIQFDVPREHAYLAARRGRQIMENFHQFDRIPVICDVEQSQTNWADKEEWVV